ncbi:TRAP transporter small permease subunit [Pararhizobium sp. IMCC21322]|uniref:TRAP transporter small permease subunit n=1 Tax=Pararhizobium sp. IMCC21322 TaxID=3067903 RepID=UPI002741A375|nr:TRAP transporter small permease subunit [Pararhizobium sp. IMCC21322]
MRALADLIDRVNKSIGRTVMWFALFIVLIQFVVVVMRYVFGVGSIFAQESITYLHGFLFMLAAAYTLLTDGHVRVDIFYRDARPRKKAMVNLVGAFLLMIPVCVLIFWTSFPYVIASWAALEGSPETSGIQARYIHKTAILAFAAMMALQGVSMAIRSLLALGGDEIEIDRLRMSQELPELREQRTEKTRAGGQT